MDARKLMKSEILTLHRDASLAEIYAVMNQYQQTDFPIVDADLNLVGMLYEENILKALADSFQSSGGNLPDFAEAVRHASRATSLRAHEMMTPDIGWVSLETDIAQIAAVMAEKGVRCLPVFGDGQVLGLISERDIFMEFLKKGLELKLPEDSSRASRPLIKKKAMTERRRYARKPVSFRLAYKKTDVHGKSAEVQGRIAQCLNLSPGGMLVQMSESTEIDDILDLVFEIPSSEVIIRRLARVTRSIPAKEGGFQTGLMFLALSVQETEGLFEYLSLLPD